MVKSEEARKRAKERNKIYSRLYYMRHSEEVKAKQAAYREAHPRRKMEDTSFDIVEHGKQLAASDPLNKFPVRSEPHEATL